MRSKAELLREMEKLEKTRGDTWNMAVDSEEYRRRLGTAELREEAALVDQFATVTLHLDAEGALVEEDLNVSEEILRDRRIWSYVIAGEQILVRRLVRPQERWVLALLDRQRAFLGRTRRRLQTWRKRSPTAGNTIGLLPYAPLFLLELLVKLQELLLLNVVKGQKAVTRTAVTLPLTVKTSIEASRTELGTKEGRRTLRMALFNLRLMTPERRQTILLLSTIFFVAVYLFSEFLVRAFAPGALDIKRSFDIVFFYAIGTRLILPTPFEPILLTALPVLGFPLLMLVAALGGVIGSWLLFLAGSQATAGLERLGKKRPWIGKSLGWAQARGRRHGYWILFAGLSIPFSPDAMAALGAVFRLRLNLFLLVIFFSVIVRSALFILVFA